MRNSGGDTAMRAGLLAAVVMGALCGAAMAAPAPGHDVRILRDDRGVAHLFGKTDADTAYGLGYVHGEDDWTDMQGAVLASRGSLAAAAGPEFLNFDYLYRLFRVRQFVDEKYEKELSPEVRAVIEAYAEGLTQFATLHPDKMPAVSLPVTGRDIVAGTTFKSAFFYLLERDLAVFFAKATGVPGLGKSMLSLREKQSDGPWWAEEVVGSNAWAVAPSRSADGATRLAVNSHMPWSGPVSWLEANLHSEEGWNMAGCMLPGSPVASMGHDENKGWAHTINKPDLVDIYALDMNQDNPLQYRFDGAWKDLETETVKIPVMGADGKQTVKEFELLWSVQGPAVRRTDGVFAIRFAGYGEVRELEQWYRMNKARNLDEFKQALALVALPSLNTVYADKAGNVLYVYGGQIPVRAAGFNWSGVVPGNSSKTLWKGFYPLQQLPQVLNPSSGFVQNCNSTPFHATVGGDNPDPAAFPKAMGIEGHETNRSRRAQALYGEDSSITHDEFLQYKYDKTCTPESDVMRWLAALFKAELPDEPLLREAVDLLKGWDHRMVKDSRAAALAFMVGWPHSRRDAWAGTPPSAVNVLRNAAKLLKDHFGRIDPPLEEVLRLRCGKIDLGLGGGPDCLRAVYAEVSDDGHLVGNSGDCYFQFVEWDKEGRLHSEAVAPYGSAAADANAPHHADQSPLFAEEKLRPVLMSEAQVRSHLQREYRPGEIKGLWYDK